jgi:hypothetical protein
MGILSSTQLLYCLALVSALPFNIKPALSLISSIRAGTTTALLSSMSEQPDIRAIDVINHHPLVEVTLCPTPSNEAKEEISSRDENVIEDMAVNMFKFLVDMHDLAHGEEENFLRDVKVETTRDLVSNMGLDKGQSFDAEVVVQRIMKLLDK